MALALEERTQIITDHRRSDNDTGSPEVQVALLTEKIKQIAEHMKEHKHDFSSRRGLVMMVGKRTRQLQYLARNDHERYRAIIKKLGLRK